MVNVSDDEANLIMNEFVSLRDSMKKNSSKALKAKYNAQIKLCAQKFDYIVQNKVKKYKAFANYEDLLQDGRLALVLALNSYELNKGSWFWWANQYIKTKISREANRHSTIKIPLKKTKTMLPHKMSSPPEKFTNDVDFDDAVKKIEIDEQKIIISNAISSLPSTHRKVIEMYYEFDSNADSSLTGICSELKISQKDCKKILSEAKKSIKMKLL